MDAKSLREAMKAKAKRLAGASSSKPDSSDFTPAEDLKAEVKTGMRPISRRAFKTGGKVEGEDNERRADRTPRGKVGLANTDQKEANAERDGEKHVGGFKKGGRTEKASGGMTTSLRPKARPADLMGQEAANSAARVDGEDVSMPKRPLRRPTAEEMKGQAMLDSAARSGDGYKKGGKTAKKNGGATGGSDSAPVSSAGGDTGGREAKRKGGEVEKHDKGCTCKACGGGVSDRMARKDGGRTGKGKTNINIIIHPNEGKDGKPAMPVPMPPPMMPKPPMPAPAAGAPMAPPPMPHGGMPAGLGAALAGAAGAPMPPAGGPAGGPPMPPMMARKSGGRVHMTAGAGSGKGRLEKIEEYGKKA